MALFRMKSNTKLIESEIPIRDIVMMQVIVEVKEEEEELPVTISCFLSIDRFKWLKEILLRMFHEMTSPTDWWMCTPAASGWWRSIGRFRCWGKKHVWLDAGRNHQSSEESQRHGRLGRDIRDGGLRLLSVSSPHFDTHLNISNSGLVKEALFMQPSIDWHRSSGFQLKDLRNWNLY